jgi:hypothetical protein
MRTGTKIRPKSLLFVMIAFLLSRFAIGQVAATSPSDSESSPTQSTWQYGGFIDAGYLYDPNHPANHLFRSRGTTFHVNEADLNIARYI